MSSSAMTDPLIVGPHDGGEGGLGLPTAAGRPTWWRGVADRCAGALSSDWLAVLLVFGLVLNLAWPTSTPYHKPEANADAEWERWLHIAAGMALTAAAVLSVLVMLRQRRALLASRGGLLALSFDTPAADTSGFREPAAHATDDWSTAFEDADVQPLVLRETAATEAVAPTAHVARLLALGQLAAGTAHDFNNILTTIQGSASLIGQHADDPAATQRFTDMILGATARGKSTTGRLLSFARREEVRPGPIDPRSVLVALHEIASHTLGHLIVVKVDPVPPLPCLMADRGQLETALLNLAINGRDAMPSGGTLTFSAAIDVVAEPGIYPAVPRPGTYVRMSVSDTGIGMERSVLERVLEPFFTTKPRGQGTGLGLPMAKAFADDSGGGLAIDSSPGLGTTVSLWLPAATTGADATLALGAQRRVLLVEDDPMVIETLLALLDDAGYHVTPVLSGAEALSALSSSSRVDALVTDMSLHDLSALALIDEAHRCRPGLPVILLTACPDQDAELAMQGAFTGTFSLLRKPVSQAHLVGRIEALIASGAQP